MMEVEYGTVMTSSKAELLIFVKFVQERIAQMCDCGRDAYAVV